MNRDEKKNFVADLHGVFEKAVGVVVAQYKGLTVSQITGLRNELRNVGAKLRVTQNKLTCLALKGTTYEPLSSLFKGTTVVAYSDTDTLGLTKITVKFAKENDRLTLIGGAADGKVLSVNDIKTLAALPSLSEARTTLVYLFQTPAAQLARVMDAYGKKAA